MPVIRKQQKQYVKIDKYVMSSPEPQRAQDVDTNIDITLVLLFSL